MLRFWMLPYEISLILNRRFSAAARGRAGLRFGLFVFERTADRVHRYLTVRKYSDKTVICLTNSLASIRSSRIQ